MRRSSEVKGVYVQGLTLTFVLGRTSGFTIGLDLTIGIETGNEGAIAATAVAVFTAGFAIYVADLCFPRQVSQPSFAVNFLFLTTGFTTFFCFTILWLSIQLLLCICLRFFFSSHRFNPFSPKLPDGIFPSHPQTGCVA